MPTPRIAGNVFAQLDTADTWGSFRWACADLDENFYYWFKNDGTLYKIELPGLTNQSTLATISNYAGMRFMVPHPTNASLLVYFNNTDGVNTVHTTTGVVTQLMTTAAFDAMLASGSLEMANLDSVKIRGNNLMLHGSGDPSGSIWDYNVSLGTATLLIAINCLSSVCELGPDAANELVISGYEAPSLILFKIDLRNDQIRVMAGIGSEGFTDGDALTEAQFVAMYELFRMADDLYYAGNANLTRWIQEGDVGSYPNFFPRFIASALPSRNMLVCQEANKVIVWN